jgi:molecular chaperone GrpE
MTMPEDKHEIEPEGPPSESHEAEKELADGEAQAAAKKARPGENIAAQDDTPARKAAKLRKLSDEELLALAEQAAKADHWLGVAQRTQADMENTIKRLRRDHEEALRFASSALAREMLPVLDNLARAIQAAEKSHDFEGLFRGLQLTKKMFDAALERNDIRPIDAQGKPFDPALHEAVMTGQDPKLGDNVVAAELEQGWMLRDRVLRASKVKVNQKPAG